MEKSSISFFASGARDFLNEIMGIVALGSAYVAIGMGIIWGGFKIKETYDEYQIEVTLQASRERLIIKQLGEINKHLEEIKRNIR